MAQPLSAPVAEHPTTSRPLVFPTDAAVPESKEHLDLRTALYLVLCRELGARAWVGSDQFVYFDPSDPSKSVAPDLFVRLGGPDEAFKSWKVWERGTPEVALEIVSESDAPPGEWEKKLAKYHAVGVLELLRFDAGATPPLRIWDRVDGDLVERRLDESRAASRVLLLDFVVRDGTLRLERKGVLLPTPDERAAAERARADRLRAKLLAAGIDPDDLSPHPRQKPPQLPPRHAQPPRCLGLVASRRGQRSLHLLEHDLPAASRRRRPEHTRHRPRGQAGPGREGGHTFEHAPTGWISRLSSSRSSLGCTSIGSSPISSRKIVPPPCATTTPREAFAAPENAPAACPNRCDSNTPVAIPATFTGASGRAPRSRRCSAGRAIHDGGGRRRRLGSFWIRTEQLTLPICHGGPRQTSPSRAHCCGTRLLSAQAQRLRRTLARSTSPAPRSDARVLPFPHGAAPLRPGR